MAIYLNPTDTTPTSIKGGVYYDASESQMKHYNGSTWVNVNKNENLLRPGDGHYTSDQYTSLLIQSNTTNNSTSFTDAGNTGHTITGAGGIKHDTAQSKIGSTSIIFINSSGTNTRWLTLPNHADWNFGTSDFTIDFWCRPISRGVSGYGAIMSFTDISNTSNNPNNLRFSGTSANLMLEGGTGTTTMTLSVDLNTWTHIAIARSGSTLKWFKNGVQDSSVSNSINYQSLGIGIHIGSSWMGYSAHAWDGYMDEIRISKGIARWTAPFTVY